jgi:hypothetical protein
VEGRGEEDMVVTERENSEGVRVATVVDGSGVFF